MPVHVVWFLIAIALLVVELASTTFYAIFLAAGAAVAGVVAFVFPDSPAWVQAVVALAVAIAGVVLVRPILGRRLQLAGPARSPRARMAASSASARWPPTRSATSCIRATSASPARCGWPSPTSTSDRGGVPVIVSAVRGTTLIVRPAGSAPAPAQIPEA